MEKLNIEGKDFTIEEIKKALGFKVNPMDKVYTYHGTTKEEFDEKYSKVSLRSKYSEIEMMIVDYKNNGWKPDLDDTSQYKYYPYFYTGNNFRLGICDYYDSSSNVPARLCFKDKKTCLEAVKEFFEEYKLSRNTI